MKDKEQTFNNLINRNQTPLNQDEKDLLFTRIIKSGKKRKIRRFIFNVGTTVLLLGLVSISIKDFLYKEKDLDIITISRYNKELVEGKSFPVLLSSDNKGHVLNVDSQELRLLQKEIAYHIDSSAINNEGYTTIYIPYGTRREITLPDDSKVWLNAGSVLTFHNNMNTHRTVYLDGEGYFDINKKATEFVIYTHKTTVRVLGTSFNFSSYSNDNFQTLDLLSGKVLFESNNNHFSSFELRPGERLNFNLINNHIHLNRNSQGDDMLWTKKQLKLNKSTLPELFKKLEKIYNVEILYNKDLRINVPYSGRINLDVDIVTLLGNIYELKDFKIALKERKVIIEK